MPDFGDIDPTTGQPNARTDYGGRDPNATPLSPEAWAEYQKKRRRDAIFGILGTLGATTGLGALGGVLGGAGAAGAAGAGALPPVAGGAPWAITPYASASMAPTGAAAVGGSIGAGMGGAGAAGAGAAGAGMGGAANTIAQGAQGGMQARDYAALIASLAGTVGGAMQTPPNMNPNTQTTDPNLQRLVQTMQGRLDQSEPLYKSIMAMANGLLPMQYQNGGQGR